MLSDNSVDACGSTFEVNNTCGLVDRDAPPPRVFFLSLREAIRGKDEWGKKTRFANYMLVNNRLLELMP